MLRRSTWFALLILVGAVAALPAQQREPAASKLTQDLSHLSKQEALYYLAAQRGVDWLQRSNRPDGRFAYIRSPDLRTRQDGDSFLRQAGAVCALGRAARYFKDEKTNALATQAVLTLLVDTKLDDAKKIRTPQIRASMISPLAAAGALLQAIHDLPKPAPDLLDQSEQLCNYIRKQQRPDGSLGEPDGDPAIAAEALLGLVRSQQHRPSAWKLESLKKANAYYQPRWGTNKNLGAAPGFCMAWAGAYQHSKDQAFADSVFALADWLCGLQYQQLEPARAAWFGGFQGWENDKATMASPDAGSALIAQALADGSRVARQVPDAQRHKHYREAVDRCLPFILSLQYTQGNTQHFAEWYRIELLGAFHASPENGTLRLDYTQHAVMALLQNLGKEGL